jgi:hypothetical protein
MKIHVHAGAHKTASTYLQTILQLNRPALAESGIGYAPLPVLRKSLTNRLHELCPSTFRIEDLFHLFFNGHGVPPEIHGLIVSDENLLGLTSAFLRSGRLYARAGDNLSHLRSLIPDREIVLFVSIRSYDEFVASIYCEGLRWSWQSFSFHEFWRKLDIESLRWPALLQRMIDALQPASVIVWRYEDFKDHEEKITSELVFGSLQAVNREVSTTLKSSMSDEAVRLIEILIGRCGRRLTAQLVPIIDRMYAKERGYAPFSPWSPEQREQLRQLYESDVRELPRSWLFPAEAVL